MEGWLAQTGYRGGLSPAPNEKYFDDSPWDTLLYLWNGWVVGWEDGGGRVGGQEVEKRKKMKASEIYKYGLYHFNMLIEKDVLK